jgi:hypothetical protein
MAQASTKHGSMRTLPIDIVTVLMDEQPSRDTTDYTSDQDKINMKNPSQKCSRTWLVGCRFGRLVIMSIVVTSFSHASTFVNEVRVGIKSRQGIIIVVTSARDQVNNDRTLVVIAFRHGRFVVVQYCGVCAARERERDKESRKTDSCVT